MTRGRCLESRRPRRPPRATPGTTPRSTGRGTQADEARGWGWVTKRSMSRLTRRGQARGKAASEAGPRMGVARDDSHRAGPLDRAGVLAQENLTPYYGSTK